MQSDNFSAKAIADTTNGNKIEAQKKMVEELKVQWKLLWRERFNDKVRAEGVSANDYTSLHVERGIVIHANRDFKPLNFKEILKQNKIENSDRFVQPEANMGGWHKFAKTKIKGKIHQNQIPSKKNSKNGAQQQKKSGRGWLNAT